jgi:hypothetical protein
MGPAMCLFTSLSNDLRANPEDIQCTLVDPHTMPYLLSTPPLSTRADGQNCPHETHDPPKRRISKAELLTQINEVVLNENDGCLSKEKCKSSVVFERTVYKHYTATMDNTRDSKADEELEVLRSERAFLEIQDVSRDEYARCRTNPSAILMPHGSAQSQSQVHQTSI